MIGPKLCCFVAYLSITHTVHVMSLTYLVHCYYISLLQYHFISFTSTLIFYQFYQTNETPQSGTLNIQFGLLNMSAVKTCFIFTILPQHLHNFACLTVLTPVAPHPHCPAIPIHVALCCLTSCHAFAAILIVILVLHIGCMFYVSFYLIQ